MKVGEVVEGGLGGVVTDAGQFVGEKLKLAAGLLSRGAGWGRGEEGHG